MSFFSPKVNRLRFFEQLSHINWSLFCLFVPSSKKYAGNETRLVFFLHLGINFYKYYFLYWFIFIKNIEATYKFHGSLINRVILNWVFMRYKNKLNYRLVIIAVLKVWVKVKCLYLTFDSYLMTNLNSIIMRFFHWKQRK